jgi:hypothetical protein
MERAFSKPDGLFPGLSQTDLAGAASAISIVFGITCAKLIRRRVVKCEEMRRHQEILRDH